MNLPPQAAETTRYTCNVCGHENQQETAGFHREIALCAGCGSNARFRGIVALLADGLGIPRRLPLRKWKTNKAMRGIGMSDWPGYAESLARLFDYRNTYYDREPRLDIQAPDPGWLGQMDFLISSDVFEHVLPPLENAYRNLHALLKPGGRLIFSVPYTRTEATVEHFSDLHEHQILDFRGRRILVNRDRAGRYTVYDDLVFHGGEGATLEMRIYCEADVLARLHDAGFVDIQVHDRPDLDIGYYWPPLAGRTPTAPKLYAYLITARKPA